mgnify:CR=1 FL=1
MHVLKGVSFSKLSGPEVEELECCGFTATVTAWPMFTVSSLSRSTVSVLELVAVVLVEGCVTLRTSRRFKVSVLAPLPRMSTVMTVKSSFRRST